MPWLDELRVRLDQFTERIVSRLKDRSRFPRNDVVYQPGGLPITPSAGISFLEHALRGLEAYHASLGRYAYPDQFPLLSDDLPASPVARIAAARVLPPQQLTIKDDLLAFYQRVLDRLCRSGEDPATFGETVYVDADLLQLIHERVNVGRAVAQAKLESDPTIAGMTHDADLLAHALRYPARETELLDVARRAAERYELDPAVAEEVFHWIIRETLHVEVEYLARICSVR